MKNKEKLNNYFLSVKKTNNSKKLKVTPFFSKKLKAKKIESLFSWKKLDCVIKNKNNEIIFKQKNVIAPQSWSQLAVDVVASKYFRRGKESSVIELVTRVVDTIEVESIKQNYLSKVDAKTFSNELKYILYSQMASFNSPVWFNLGLSQKYKLKSKSRVYTFDSIKKSIIEIDDAYLKPQISACFIQSVDDSLEGIFELAKTEAKLFKFGSGSGTNFSNIRSKYEDISTGGKSSGLITFLEVLDKGAGAIKSGGVSRRAAKMVCLDVDHPEIIEFIEWKKKEEKKAQALIQSGYPSDYEGEAYRTISGQNSNNSVRLSDKFLNAVKKNKNWPLKERLSKKTIQVVDANLIWNKIINSAWECADPGVQYEDAIQKWHTCKSSDRIYSSNPCSEYMFLNDSACNLASINLIKFLKTDGTFDFNSFSYVASLIFLAQEILVDAASYPTPKIAQNSHDFRPLGLGFANLGSLLMGMGLSYDSDEGRSLASLISAHLTGVAYLTSIEVSKVKGVFKAYKKNQKDFLEVMKLHQKAVESIKITTPELSTNIAHKNNREFKANSQKNIKKLINLKNVKLNDQIQPANNYKVQINLPSENEKKSYSNLSVRNEASVALNSDLEFFLDFNQDKALEQKLKFNSVLQSAKLITIQIWKDLISNGKKFGFRNSQSTVVAPTGTIGFMMDCDTTGIEPDFSLVKYKKLSGGGDLKLVNQTVLPALKKLGYEQVQIDEIMNHIKSYGDVFQAPYLSEKDRLVFQTASGPGCLSPTSHLQMMAAVQPFISGAISKTVNIPEKSTVEDVANIYFAAWTLGLKAVAIYRDNSKWSQPMSRAFKNMLCHDCNVETELVSGCFRCPNCGTTVGCS